MAKRRMNKKEDLLKKLKEQERHRSVDKTAKELLDSIRKMFKEVEENGPKKL